MPKKKMETFHPNGRAIGNNAKKKKTHKLENFLFSLSEVSIHEFYFFLNVIKPHFYGIAPIRF